MAAALGNLARIALAQHRPADALALAQRAASVQEKAGAAAHELAQTRFVLAQARWELPPDDGGDRVRALALAEQARDDLAAAGAKGPPPEVLQEVEQWLDARRDGSPSSPPRAPSPVAPASSRPPPE